MPYEVGDSSAKTSSLGMVSTRRRFDLVDCIMSESLGTLDRRLAGAGDRSLRADVVDWYVVDRPNPGRAGRDSSGSATGGSGYLLDGVRWDLMLGRISGIDGSSD